MVANTVNFATAPETETFTLTVGVDDVKNTIETGYTRNEYGSISPSSKFLDIYATNAHQVDECYLHSGQNRFYFKISGDSTVTNSGWTSITIPNVGTLNRSSASFVSGTNAGTWYWTSQTTAPTSGTVTITI